MTTDHFFMFVPLGVLLMLVAGSPNRGITCDNADLSRSTGLAEPPAATASTVAGASTALRFRVTEIPLRYSLSTDRLAINASGDVVGTYQNHEGNRRGDCAFLYHNGTVTDIKSNGDDRTIAVGLNDRGQVLVYRRILNGSEAPFVWEGGQFVPIGPMPKAFAVSDRGYKTVMPVGDYTVCSINNSGDVAGYLEQGELPPDSVPEVRPFRWHNGALTIATEHAQLGRKSDAVALPEYPTILEDGVYNFQAQAMNDDGDIVGDSPGGGFVGFGLAAVVWKNGHGTVIQVADGRSTLGVKPMALLSKSGGVDSLHPFALNSRAEWVGTHFGTYVGMQRFREAIAFGVIGGRACLWASEESGVQDLSEKFENLPDDAAAQRTSINSDAYGMNDNGQIVGEVDEVATNPRTGKRLEQRACLWLNRKAYDLNTMIDQPKNGVLARAYGINNSGQIIAVGPRTDFHDPVYRHAYLLTPAKP